MNINRFIITLAIVSAITSIGGPAVALAPAVQTMAVQASTDPGGTFFDDDDSLFEASIEAIAAVGVTKGCNPERTSFCPDRTITRGEMAAFLVRAFDLTAQDPNIDFTDDNTSMFENAIEKLATAGITKSCNPPDNTRFCPKANVTRGQMAAFLARGVPYALIAVPDRPATVNGTLLDTFSPFDKNTGWCTGADGEVCRTTINVSQGEFHLFEYWVSSVQTSISDFVPWSSFTPAVQDAYLSDQVRIEAYLNGGKLSLVATTSLEDEVMYKDYTFQFPSTLTGTHTIHVFYIDELNSYQSSILVTVNITALSSIQELSIPPTDSTDRPPLKAAFSAG